jgi:hypothetical protein
MLQAPVYQIRLPKRCVFSCPHLARKSNNFSPAARAREGVLISLPKKRSNGRRNLIGPLHLTKPGRERVRGDQKSELAPWRQCALALHSLQPLRAPGGAPTTACSSSASRREAGMQVQRHAGWSWGVCETADARLLATSEN